jgi:hypothetical protein
MDAKNSLAPRSELASLFENRKCAEPVCVNGENMTEQQTNKATRILAARREEEGIAMKNLQ